MHNQTFSVVLESTTESSSHIFLYKKKADECKRDYIEGENHWSAKKGLILNNWANNLEALIQYGELPIQINEISGYISKELREAGLSEGAIDYIYDVLPQKYRRNYVYQSGKSHFTSSKPSLYDLAGEDDIKEFENPQKNLYQYKNKVKQMTPTELQEEYLKLQRIKKERRVHEKAQQEILEMESIDSKIPLPFYKKTSADIPPEELHGETLAYHETMLLAEDYLQIHKYLVDIAKTIKQFKPSEEKGTEYGMRIRDYRQGFMRAHKSIFIPYSDKKWSGDLIEWSNIQLSKLAHGKNAAGTMHARDTGQIAVKIKKDGTYQYVKLDRDITREQVGDKSPELWELFKVFLASHEITNILHEWSYETFVLEGEMPQQ